MKKPKSSPQRHTFQKERYIERCKKDNKIPSADYLDMFEQIIKEENTKFTDPKTRINNMEYDLRTNDYIIDKCKQSESYAQNLYAAICNNEFQKNDVWPRLKGQTWGCSWRYAGGIIADILEQGDYIDWYCSGIRNRESDESTLTDAQRERLKVIDKFVGEGYVTDEIKQDLFHIGWTVIDTPD